MKQGREENTCREECAELEDLFNRETQSARPEGGGRYPPGEDIGTKKKKSQGFVLRERLGLHFGEKKRDRGDDKVERSCKLKRRKVPA